MVRYFGSLPIKRWHSYENRHLLNITVSTLYRRDEFELVITPPYQVSGDMAKAYAVLGVDNPVVHPGSQKAERIEARWLKSNR